MTMKSRGQSVVQLMIAMGLLSGLALFFADLASNAQKSQNSVRIASDFNNLVTLIQMAMQNQVLCSSNINATNLASLTFDSTPQTLANQSITVNKLTYPSAGSSPIVQLNSAPFSGLTISALQLQGFQEVIPGSSYLAALHVEGTKGKGAFLGSKVLRTNVPVLLQTHYSADPIVTLDACGPAMGNLSFGGIFAAGVTSNAAGVPTAYNNWPNPWTGMGNCPLGFSSYGFLSGAWKDAFNNTHSNYGGTYCLSNNQPTVATFGGMYSTTGGTFQAQVNPITNGQSCPSGFTAYLLGNGNYKDGSADPSPFGLYYCGATGNVAGGRVFGGMFSTTAGSAAAYKNPLTAGFSCPSGFTAHTLGGAGYTDANGDFASFQIRYCLK